MIANHLSLTAIAHTCDDAAHGDDPAADRDHQVGVAFP
jgi:hypothetical protein